MPQYSGDLIVITFNIISVMQSDNVVNLTLHSELVLLNLLKADEKMTKFATATLNIGKFIILKETQGHAIQ